MNFETSDIISISAVGVSFGSLFVAWLSLCNSRKGLRLKEAELSERELPVKAYLIDCFTFIEEENKCCAFAISYTNQSTSPKSFSSLELEIGYYDDKDLFGKAIFQPEEEVVPFVMNHKYKKLDLPLNLLPGETISGWVAFILPPKSILNFRVDTYRVVGKSFDGKESSISAYLLRSMENEKKA